MTFIVPKTKPEYEIIATFEIFDTKSKKRTKKTTRVDVAVDMKEAHKKLRENKWQWVERPTTIKSRETVVVGRNPWDGSEIYEERFEYNYELVREPRTPFYGFNPDGVNIIEKFKYAKIKKIA